MKKFLLVSVLLLVAAFVGYWVFAIAQSALFFFAIFCFPDAVDMEAVAYSADAEINGFHFQVDLHRNHSLLAEYRKVVKVKKGEKLILEREFIDTGGMASFYVLRQGDRIIVLDGIRNGFVLDARTGEISKVDIDSIPPKFWEQNIGRFMFVREEKRTYKWILKDDIPIEAK